ncbi:MAG: hypothetical protein ABR552_08120 [Actinomycetota bacterium]
MNPAMIEQDELAVLDTAREALRTAAADAENRGETTEGRTLWSLYHVADMVCRIGRHRSDTHYIPEKATRLVGAALTARKAVADQYRVARIGATSWESPLLDITAREQELDEAIATVLWSIARGESIYLSDARALMRAVTDLSKWAEKVAGAALPDPTD